MDVDSVQVDANPRLQEPADAEGHLVGSSKVQAEFDNNNGDAVSIDVDADAKAVVENL
jgi:hypothetical protein